MYAGSEQATKCQLAILYSLNHNHNLMAISFVVFDPLNINPCCSCISSCMTLLIQLAATRYQFLFLPMHLAAS